MNWVRGVVDLVWLALVAASIAAIVHGDGDSRWN
jgi:hypothetical protein